MAESKGARGYLTGEVDVAQEKLRAYLARAPDRRRLRVGEVVQRMETEIAAMKERGFSTTEIVAAIAECGVKISVNALASQWAALQKKKASQKGSAKVGASGSGGGNTNRKAASVAVSTATRKLPVSDVKGPSSTSDLTA